MEGRPTREVALPARGLGELRRALRDEVGPLATVRGLHAAGFSAGDGLFQAFTRTLDGPAVEMAHDELWERVSRFFQQKGWGSLQHRQPHPGIGVLESPDWAEAEAGTENQPSCSFATGLLSGFLSQLAGGDVAVIEVGCASRGDRACTFAFGSEAAVHGLYGHLVEGAAFEAALEQL
jgi:hypothetical protein